MRKELDISTWERKSHFYLFKDFEREGNLSIAKTVKHKILVPKENRKGVIHYTTIPWISLTSVSHARKLNTSDTMLQSFLNRSVTILLLLKNY